MNDRTKDSQKRTFGMASFVEVRNRWSRIDKGATVSTNRLRSWLLPLDLSLHS